VKSNLSAKRAIPPSVRNPLTATSRADASPLDDVRLRDWLGFELSGPLRSASGAVEADECRRPRNGHRPMAIVSVTQVDGNDTCTSAGRAAAIAMQRAGTTEQRLAALREYGFTYRGDGSRKTRLGPRQSPRVLVAVREAEDDGVAVQSDDSKPRARRRTRNCSETAHP
jgi:hypothetical protein